MEPYFIGITGGSASGKTSIIRQLEAAFTSDELTVVSQDNYYKDLHEHEPDEDGLINFDHPDAVNLDLLHAHLLQIKKGEPAAVREYTFNNPSVQMQKMVHYAPAPLVIVEGLFVYYKPEIRRLFQLKVFIEVEEHIKLVRRIRRDHADRGYGLDEILDQYVVNVAPMYRRYIEPYKFDADVVIMNNAQAHIGTQVIINHLKYIIEHK